MKLQAGQNEAALPLNRTELSLGTRLEMTSAAWTNHSSHRLPPTAYRLPPTFSMTSHSAAAFIPSIHLRCPAPVILHPAHHNPQPIRPPSPTLSPTRRTIPPHATHSPSEPPPPSPPPQNNSGPFHALRLWWQNRANKASTLRNYGVAAILSYGLFDAITYSISFLLSLRAYLAAGKVLTWKTLPQVLALMWGINNLSRPFRIAGALAIAPLVDVRIVKPIAAAINRLRNRHDSN